MNPVPSKQCKASNLLAPKWMVSYQRNPSLRVDYSLSNPYPNPCWKHSARSVFSYLCSLQIIQCMRPGSQYIGERCSGHVTKEARPLRWAYGMAQKNDRFLATACRAGHEERSISFLCTGQGQAVGLRPMDPCAPPCIHWKRCSWCWRQKTPPICQAAIPCRTSACWHNAWLRWVAVARRMLQWVGTEL